MINENYRSEDRVWSYDASAAAFFR